MYLDAALPLFFSSFGTQRVNLSPLFPAMDSLVKEEILEEAATAPETVRPPDTPAVIELSSSDDDDDDVATGKKSGDLEGVLGEGGPLKRRRLDDGAGVALPLGFLDPLPPEDDQPRLPISVARPPVPAIQSFRQFWKAGDFEGDVVVDSSSFSAGMDHLRVHPKFLHSNATSHKWALGAFAELLDNALDEVCHGATFANIDVLENKKDGSKMFLIEDNGGGMDPDKMRQCMSLGYSTKSKLANTIGQYGNGFKTSTMRLGADVIVFSRCLGKGGNGLSQSIGMLSYTFLRNTGKEDIIVPMLDYEKDGQNWSKLIRKSSVDWHKNLETILQWSPYLSEVDLLQEFSSMSDQGTRIIIYNLWEDDQGELELDFSTDKHDIQLRGVNRDEKKIQMAERFPNSKHFLTYQHSLRSYASILYLRLPQGFRMILRGKVIVHHNIVNDMMLKQEVTYKPQPGSEGIPRDTNMVAVATIGFVKDAKDHIDVQGFNVYHKNRLIKPFWRVWNAAGSDGRGVIGVLEANFVEPAHDKQGFERTTVLARLEARLVQMQKQYWRTNCHRVGYAPRQKEKCFNDSLDKESLPKEDTRPSSQQSKKEASSRSAPVSKSRGSVRLLNTDKSNSHLNPMSVGNGNCLPVASINMEDSNGHFSVGREIRKGGADFLGDKTSAPHLRFHKPLHASYETEVECNPTERLVNGSGGPRPFFLKDSNCSPLSSSPHVGNNGMEKHHASKGGTSGIVTRSHSKETGAISNGIEPRLQDSDVAIIEQLEDENRELKDRLKEMGESMLQELQCEREQNKLLREKLEAAEKKLEEANREQEALIDIFSEERSRRDKEEENLRKKLKDASTTIQDLLEKLSSGRNNI